MARKSKAQARAERRAEQERQRREAARKKAIRNAVVAVGSVAFVVLALIALWPRTTAEEQAAIDASDISATGWDLPELDGDGRIRIADFRGKPTVAAFFANWCPECEEEIPEFLALSRQLGDRVSFVGINSQDNARGLGDAEKWGIVGEWPLARDVGHTAASGLSMATFGARGMPLTVIYTADGEVHEVVRGRISAERLLGILESLGV